MSFSPTPLLGSFIQYFQVMKYLLGINFKEDFIKLQGWVDRNLAAMDGSDRNIKPQIERNVVAAFTKCCHHGGYNIASSTWCLPFGTTPTKKYMCTHTQSYQVILN